MSYYPKTDNHSRNKTKKWITFVLLCKKILLNKSRKSEIYRLDADKLEIIVMI